ncbi:MAG: nitronate monooxygenase, partial [Nitrospinae bacterium]|nr:nitronate monooxygenase [Nitrospinota bacterium]
SGAKVVCFTPTVGLGKKMLKSGVDALVLEGNEAGGHIGPVSTSILVQEILPFFPDIPVFIAGGIGTGSMIASYLQLGASGAQLGTRFVATEECSAHENFKKVFLRAKSKDAVATAQFDPALPVIPVRALVNEGTKDFNALQLEMLTKVKAGEVEVKDAQLKLEEYWLGALRKAVVDGDIAHGSLMAGQSVGLVKEIMPVKDIINELVEDAEKALAAGK